MSDLQPTTPPKKRGRKPLDMTPEEKAIRKSERAKLYYELNKEQLKFQISERTTRLRIERRQEMGMDVKYGDKLTAGRIPKALLLAQ